jgi:tetratricopeptide (TPR) repeat protein
LQGKWPKSRLRAVAYTEGKNPQADFPALDEVLAELEDVMGLVYLGNTYGMRPVHDDEQALQCFERALKLQPENLPALYNKAAILAIRGQNTDALELLNRNV